jgi:DNA-binding FrmR family transcriptional regulator
MLLLTALVGPSILCERAWLHVSQELCTRRGAIAVTDQAGSREQNEILTRLRRVEGQVRGIQRMIEEERDCEAIVTQLLAARAALDKTGMLIMGQHIERCLLNARDGAGSEGLERVMSYFLQFARPSESDQHAAVLKDDMAQPG